MMTRRSALKTSLAAATVCAASPLSFVSRTSGQNATAATNGPFTVPPLPYAFDALEPHIDAKTMEIHHDKHHATYVANLNKAVAEAPALHSKSLKEILQDLNSVPEGVRTAVRNQGGGHYNHTLFWQMMAKDGGKEPSGELAAAIDKAFGSFGGFKDKFTETATKVFGSGWAWLVRDGQVLKIEPSSNQDTPLSQGRTPLLGIDVWEHAYYLKYQNRRPEYISEWFKVVNWDFVSERFARGRE
jgi:Fe-Mn family superoxide dismutase